MTFQPKRYVKIGFLVLLLTVVGSPVVNWCRDTFQLPAGYGAAGDLRFNRPMPAGVREAVDDLSAGAEGNWVQERVDGGMRVYDLHLLRDGKPSVIQLTEAGQVTSRTAPDPTSSFEVEAGE